MQGPAFALAHRLISICFNLVFVTCQKHKKERLVNNGSQDFCEPYFQKNKTQKFHTYQLPPHRMATALPAPRDSLPGSVQVIIAGAGPTGLLAANLLGLYGVETLVIDKKGEMSQLPKAILLDDTAFRALQAIGLAEQMRQRTILGYGARYLTADLECFASNEDLKGANGYPRRNSFSQPVLEGILLQGLCRWPSVRTCFHTAVADLDSAEDSVTIHVERTSDSTRHSITAKYVLACDGGQSRLRSLFGVKMVGRFNEQDWLVCGAWP